MHTIKYTFQPHGDDRGQLVSLEEFNDIPFRIKRVYYMYDTLPDVVRGKHAHKKLQQILVCVHGSCKIRLDNGKEKRLFSKLVILLRNAVIEQVSSEHVNSPEVITELSQSSLDVDHNLLCTTS